MSSSQSSRSPSPEPKEKKKKSKNKDGEKVKDKGKKSDKKKSKEKGKDKSKETKNEGQDRNWAYKPPRGMVELDASRVDEEFDWDALKDDEDKELCLFRIPDGFKAKNLDGLEISLPSGPSETSQKITTFEKKRSKLEIWSVGTNDADEDRDTRGQELHGITCLLPRSKKKGALYIAPKPIIHRLLIIHSAATPITGTEDTLASAPREAVPQEVLKHRFLPYGATSPGDKRPEEDTMELEPPSNSIGENIPSSPSKTDSPRKSSKKRKSGHGDSEESSPKKSKKLKAQ